MKIDFKKIAFLLTLVFITASCNSDDDDKDSSSRVVKYEVSGNFDSFNDVNYTGANGETVNEDIGAVNKYTWTKEITLDGDVDEINFSLIGVSGNVGNNLTARIYYKGKLVGEKIGTADANGNISIVVETYKVPN